MSDFGTFGRYDEISLVEMDGDQRRSYERLVESHGQVVGPFKIMLQNPKLIEVIAPLWDYFRNDSSLSKAEIEIVTNITNGRWLAAYSNYRHEKVGKIAGSLSSEKVEALIAGLPTSFDDARQQVTYELALTLTKPRVVPVGMFERAVTLLGDRGVTDITALIGYFTLISMTLMAYDVPSNAVGLER